MNLKQLIEDVKVNSKAHALDLQQALLDNEDVADLSVKIRPYSHSQALKGDWLLIIEGEWVDERWIVTHDGEIAELSENGSERHLSYSIPNAIDRTFPQIVHYKVRRVIKDMGFDVRTTGLGKTSTTVISFEKYNIELDWDAHKQAMIILRGNGTGTPCKTIKEVIDFIEAL